MKCIRMKWPIRSCDMWSWPTPNNQAERSVASIVAVSERGSTFIGSANSVSIHEAYRNTYHMMERVQRKKEDFSLQYLLTIEIWLFDEISFEYV